MTRNKICCACSEFVLLISKSTKVAQVAIFTWETGGCSRCPPSATRSNRTKTCQSEYTAPTARDKETVTQTYTKNANKNECLHVLCIWHERRSSAWACSTSPVCIRSCYRSVPAMAAARCRSTSGS
jgi:hypothetical protein